MLSLVRLNRFSFAKSSIFLDSLPPIIYPTSIKNFAKGLILRSKSDFDAPRNSRAKYGQVGSHDHKVDEYANAGLERGESMIPSHVALCLDGNRRWFKKHGLDYITYWPFFQANMRFVEYCLKWGVGTATTYMYGLGNIKYRSKEANAVIFGEFERFLKEGLETFTRKGVKVSVVGELSMLSESSQMLVKQVEEATKNNTNLDLMLPMCYTSQRDIVNATRSICNKVKEGELELEDVNEELFEQHLAFGSSRPPLDLYIRTGGQLRIGMLLAWQVPYTELYISDALAPDFGEEVFLDALRSFQQRVRLFGG